MLNWKDLPWQEQVGIRQALQHEERRTAFLLAQAQRPSQMYKPELRAISPREWCALLGDLTAYGETPEKAMLEFDRVWMEGHGKRKS